MTEINHLDKEPMIVGELLSFNFRGQNYKVEAVDFAQESFRIGQVSSEYPLIAIDYIDMLNELELESEQWKNLRDDDLKEDARLQEES